MGEFIMDDQRKPLPKGQFQEYEIVDTIGLGGSSLCYLVKKNDTFFIMKELYPLDLAGYLFRNEQKLLLRDEKNQNLIRLLNQSRDDFLIEAKISKELSHVQREYSLPGENPYFSSLHDQFKVADSHAHYLIYQSSQGRTLDTYKSYKAKDDKSRLLENLDLLGRLAEAVSEIHNHGYLHLDLKSDNIYVLAYETPVVQVLDMGSALDRKQIYNTDINHLIRRVSFSDRYSSMKLREINKLKNDMHFIEGMLVSTGSKDTDLPSRKREILDIIHQLDESDDIYSLYVIMSELITGTRYEDSDLYDCIMTSEQLSFLPKAVKEDLHVRISSGLNNPSRIDRFTSDLEEFKEIVKSEGIHFVLMRFKCRIDYQNKRKLMMYKIHEGIYAQCTVGSDVKYMMIFKYLIRRTVPKEIEIAEYRHSLVMEVVGKSTQLMVVWDWLLKSKDLSLLSTFR
jgi:serine/threonine protein kinase